jgi:hypothetical protein
LHKTLKPLQAKFVALIDISSNLEIWIKKAFLCLAALAQPTKLDAFWLLAKHEPDGLPAGEVARRLAVPQNTS